MFMCENCKILPAVLKINYTRDYECLCRKCYNMYLRDCIFRYTNRHIEDLLLAMRSLTNDIEYL